MARADKHTNNAPQKGGSNLNKVAIGAFVIGVIGLVAIDELAGKLFFLLVAAVGGFLFARPFIMKSKSKQSDPQPLQQFQRQSAASTPAPPAEFINAAGHRQGSLYEFVPVRVAGVTFKNGRRHRQTILRQIYWKDEPYDQEVDVTLRQGQYEGQPTVEVWADKEQIGFVPKEQLPFFVSNWHRYHSALDLEVSGGGKRPDGEQVPFGAEFTARFLSETN